MLVMPNNCVSIAPFSTALDKWNFDRHLTKWDFSGDLVLDGGLGTQTYIISHDICLQYYQLLMMYVQY